MFQPSSVNESQHSQSEATGRLFAQHYEVSLRTAYRILRSREDSEDAVQTAYLAAFRSLHLFRGEASFKTWITRIVSNCCLMQLRERRSRPWVPLDNLAPTAPLPDPQAVTPEAQYSWRELQAAHATAVSGLPRHLRDVYVPYAVSGAPLATVADSLGLTPAAAKSRFFRARLKVEHSLQGASRRRAA
jgi:RNA polymerase sigma-70 factor, ECF subfamily